MTLYLLMPGLNEAGNVPRVLRSVVEFQARHHKQFAVRVVFVDDGSTDSTRSVLQEEDEVDVTVLSHATPQGPGAAFATGFSHLATRLAPGDFVATMEADNTSRLEILDQMLARAREGHDVVLASPYMYGGGIVNTNFWRTGLSHAANSFVKGALGIRGILTVSSFYRLVTADAIRSLQYVYGPAIVERVGFECMVEQLMKMIYMQMSISEVPMILDTSRRAGPSKMKVARTVRGYVALARMRHGWERRVSQGHPV